MENLAPNEANVNNEANGRHGLFLDPTGLVITDMQTQLAALRESRAAEGGKGYIKVADRVEVFRRGFGTEFSIATDIVSAGSYPGASVIVKATIAVVDTGRIVATGYAEEIRGNGFINATSALENAETSAIGRALAAFGLCGGEYASQNEIDGAVRKQAASDAVSAPPPPAPFDGKLPTLALFKPREATDEPAADAKEPETWAVAGTPDALEKAVALHPIFVPEDDDIETWVGTYTLVADVIDRADTIQFLVDFYRVNVRFLDAVKAREEASYASILQALKSRKAAIAAAATTD